MANDYKLWLGLQAILVDFASRLRSDCGVKPTNHLRWENRPIEICPRKSGDTTQSKTWVKQYVLQQFWELEAIELAFKNEGTEWHGSLLGKWVDVETVEEE